jgi:hypothetical protein
MKSAYELAMERMEKQFGPSKKLTDAQRDAMGDMDRKYEAREAEIRLSFENRINNAISADELEQLKQELAHDLQSLAEKRQRDKDAIWNEA